MIKLFLIVFLPVILVYCHDGIKEIQEISVKTLEEFKEELGPTEWHPSEQFTYFEATHLWFRKVLWMKIGEYWTKMLGL